MTSYAADALGANAMRRMPEWEKRTERIMRGILERGGKLSREELIWFVKRQLRHIREERIL